MSTQQTQISPTPNLKEMQAPQASKQIKTAISDLMKALTTSADPVSEIEKLKACGALEQLFPEIAETWGEKGRQDKKWHPEGNVWTHTMLVMQNLAHRRSPLLNITALFHDIGKPRSFHEWPNGGISNHKHEDFSAEIFSSKIAPLLPIDNDTKLKVERLIRNHMKLHYIDDESKVSHKDFVEILSDPLIHQMIELQYADVTGSGRPIGDRNRDVKRMFFLRFLGLPKSEWRR